MPEMPVVDKEERERVRRGLNRYKELHGGIGDPELQQRIMFALGCPDSAVPLSTLQRFIKGTHRTDDVMVRRYRKFLSAVAPPPVEDEFGTALSRFLAAYPQDITALAGDYRTFVQAHQSKTDAPAGFTVGCTQVRLRPGADVTVLRATEFVVDPELPGGKARATSWLGNTGVFASLGGDRYLMIVRSIMEVRIYQLRKVLDKPLTLHGHALQPGNAFALPLGWRGDGEQPVTDFVMSAVNTSSE